MANAKRKSIYQGARDVWEQALSSVKSLSRFFKTQSRDKRTVKTTQKALRELSEGRTNKEIGEQLGIPYQRVTSLKRKISQGEAYSPELRDILKEAASVYNEEPRKLEGGVWYFPNRDKVKKSVKKIDHIKTFPELIDAVKFWSKVIKSDEFIAIIPITINAKTGKKMTYYELVGFGKRTQRPKGGKIQDKRAKNRIDDLLRKYPR